MPQDMMCSACNGEHLAVMQRKPYSSYDEFWKQDFEYIYTQCGGLSDPTDVELPDLGLIGADPLDSDCCLTQEWSTTSGAGESRKETAWAHQTSSVSLFMANHACIIPCPSDL